MKDQPVFLDPIGKKPSRRTVLKYGAALSALPAMGAKTLAEEVTLSDALKAFVPQKDKKLSPEWLASLQKRGKPSVWESAEERRYLGIPAGGIGSGTVYYGADGRLWCWDIFNEPHEGVVPHIGSGPEADITKLKERDGSNYVQPPAGQSPWNLDNGFTLRFSDGTTRRLDDTGFRKIRCVGQYPAPEYHYADADSPIQATLTAVAPFLPLDYDTSSLPVTFQVWKLTNTSQATVHVALEGRMENGVLKLLKDGQKLWRRVRHVNADGVTLVTGDVVAIGGDAPSEEIRSRGDYGSFALALVGDGVPKLPNVVTLVDKQELCVATRSMTIEPGQSRSFTFVLGWYFPGVAERITHGSASLPNAKRWVATQFSDAGGLVAHAARSAERTIAAVCSFRDTWYGSEQGENRGTLPYWLLERALWTSSTLTTNVAYRLNDNKFWAWEGIGACEGTCMHVYHYGQGMGRLFPQIERQLREGTDFTSIAFRQDGSVDFRGGMAGTWAVDAQAGLVLRCWRQHCTDASGQFVTQNWPHIHKAMQFLIDVDAKGKMGPDGVPAGSMHNTLDANWTGKIPWFISMYNAALIAAVAMAEEVGDTEFAVLCKGIVAKGKKAYTQLFQRDAGYYMADATPEQMLPIHIGHGCHIDQALGDWWLAQAGLPAFGEKAQLRSAMQALFENNFVPDMGAFRRQWKAEQRGRPYSIGHEAGLILCTWPVGGLPEKARDFWSFGYFQECMSGFEHAAAALMISLAESAEDPLLQNGLTVERAIHDRYDASKRNPFNEIECSDHYGRAMASYGVLLAACGFHCHRSSGLLRFAPQWSADDFAAPFITADAWGRFAQQRRAGRLTVVIDVRFGALQLGVLELAHSTSYKTTTLKIAGKEIKHATALEDGRIVVKLHAPTVVPREGRVEFTAM